MGFTDAKIQFVSPAFTTSTGYTSEKVLGHDSRILESGCSRPEVCVQLWRTVSGRQSRMNAPEMTGRV
jgi:PAS domain S-box-containing protein